MKELLKEQDSIINQIKHIDESIQRMMMVNRAAVNKLIELNKKYKEETKQLEG